MKTKIDLNGSVQSQGRIDFSSADSILVRRIFSSRVLKDLANGKLPVELGEVLDSVRFDRRLVDGITLSDFYDQAFRYCFKCQRVEYFYKNAIIQKLVIGRSSLSATAAFLEVRIADSKLDVLLAKDHIRAFEIKTDFDELARLPAQLLAYQRACREVSVVTSDRYASAIERLVGNEVGIYVLTDRYQLRTIRAPEKFDSSLMHSEMLALLRRRELLEFFDACGRDSTGIPNTRIYQEAIAVSLDIGSVELNSFVASCLLRRSAVKETLVNGLPMSLAASALAQDLTRVQVYRLINLFEMDVTGEGSNGLLSVLSS